MLLTGLLLDTGRHVLTNSLVGLATSFAAGFQIGDTYGYLPDKSDSGPRGTIVHIGSTNDIAVTRVDDATVRFVCSIPEGFGPFQIGNCVLYMQDENSNAIPFVEVVLPFAVQKLPSNDQVTTDGYTLPGNRFAVSIEVKFTDQIAGVTCVILPPDYSSLPAFATEADVPPASAMTYKTFVVNYDTRAKAPVLMAIDENNVTWGNPLYTQLHDPRFGHLDGGRDGDGYGGEAEEIVFGHWYTTPEAAFTTNPIGGASYTDDDNALQTIGGAVYTDTVNVGKKAYDNL